MKTLIQLFQFSFLILILISCEKKEKDETDLIGNWVYAENNLETFEFKNTTDVLINEQEFEYKIIGDSIEFSYNGPLYIAIRPSKHKFELQNDSILMIENLDRLQFFDGESGENILNRIN